MWRLFVLSIASQLIHRRKTIRVCICNPNPNHISYYWAPNLTLTYYHVAPVETLSVFLTCLEALTGEELPMLFLC